MQPLKILIIEENDLTAMTLASAQEAMPNSNISVVFGTGARLKDVMQCTKGVTLCVKSGVLLRAGLINMPPLATLANYPICISRSAVFLDHPQQAHTYGLAGIEAHKGMVDTSVFVINPSLWPHTPQQDRGALRDMPKLVMPRYMNHKDDPVLLDCLTAWSALQYGMLGLGAGINNYTSVYLRGSAAPIEMYGYPLELALPYIEDLPPRLKDRVAKVANKTQVVAGKLRTGLQQFFG